MLLLLFLLQFLAEFNHASPAPTRRQPDKQHRHHKTLIAGIGPSTTTAALVVSPTPPPVASPIPTQVSPPPCQAKVFDTPWSLSDITIFTPLNQTSAPSTHGTISFHFTDTNPRLHLGTDCSGTVINGVCGGDDGGYVLCENENVAFKLQQELLMVTRYYIDDCLGPWPYNSGEAFGQNQTKLAVTKGTAGSMAIQEHLLVEITAMA